MHAHLPRLARHLLALASRRYIERRDPDFIVGAADPAGPYLLRWYVTPWRRWPEQAQANPTAWRRAKACVARWLPNVYVHLFLRDDDDRALHDHPSWAMSLILDGEYIEHTIAAGGIHGRRVWREGALRLLPTRHAHRIELTRMGVASTHGADRISVPCVTLFVFGPVLREWGFHCPERGWVHWRDFTAPGRPGEIGGGCD